MRQKLLTKLTNCPKSGLKQTARNSADALDFERANPVAASWIKNGRGINNYPKADHSVLALRRIRNKEPHDDQKV